MQSVIATLNVISTLPNTVKRDAGVAHCRLEIHLLPHGQGFRQLRPRRPQRYATVPEWSTAEKRGSFEANVHRQKQSYQLVLSAPSKSRFSGFLRFETWIA
jgi:hypothetical protein